jgi:hypothetical protein
MLASGNARKSWRSTRVAQQLGIDYPIVRAPFGGLPSQRLTATVGDWIKRGGGHTTGSSAACWVRKFGSWLLLIGHPICRICHQFLLIKENRQRRSFLRPRTATGTVPQRQGSRDARGPLPRRMTNHQLYSGTYGRIRVIRHGRGRFRRWGTRLASLCPVKPGAGAQRA